MRTVYLLMAAAAIATLSVSCTKGQLEGEEGGAQAKVPVSFTSRAAGQAVTTDQSGAQAAGTKTALQDGTKVVWTTGDTLSLFGSEGGSQTQLVLESIDETDGSVATFSGEAVQSETYYALYPYDSEAAMSGSAILTDLPSEQAACGDGTFGTGVNLSAAVSEGTSLQFENLCGLLTVTLSSVPAEEYVLESVTLEGRNGEKIAGAVSVSVPGLEATAGEGAVTSVTLKAAEGAALTADTYVFTIIPATFTNGIKLTFDYGTNGKAEVVSDKALTVNAGENHVLRALDAKIQTLVPLDEIRHWPNDDNTGALPNEMTNYNDESTPDYGSFPYSMLFDGITDNESNMWHTTSTGIANYSLTEDHPIIATFDLGNIYYLSSYKVWGRYGGTIDDPMGNKNNSGGFNDYFAFGCYNPRKFKLYGSAEEPKNTSDEAYWAVNGEWLNDWTLLADSEVIRPSLNVPTAPVSGSDLPANYWVPTAEDYEAAAAGFEFEIDRNLPAVRYVRIVITETWDTLERYRISFGELHFYSYTPYSEK